MIQYVKEICVTLVICIAVIICTANVSRADDNSNLNDSTSFSNDYSTVTYTDPETGKQITVKTNPDINIKPDEQIVINQANGTNFYSQEAANAQDNIELYSAKVKEEYWRAIDAELIIQGEGTIGDIAKIIKQKTDEFGYNFTDDECFVMAFEAWQSGVYQPVASEMQKLINRTFEYLTPRMVKNYRDVTEWADKQAGLGIEKGVKKIFDTALEPIHNEIKKLTSKIDNEVIRDTFANFASSFVNRSVEGLQDNAVAWLGEKLGLDLKKNTERKIQKSKNDSTIDGIETTSNGTTDDTDGVVPDRQTWRWESELAYAALAATNTYVANLVNQEMGKLNQHFVEAATKAGVRVDMANSFTKTLTKFITGNISMYLGDVITAGKLKVELATSGILSAESFANNAYEKVTVEGVGETYRKVSSEIVDKYKKGELSDADAEKIVQDTRDAMYDKYSTFGKETLTTMAGQIGTMTKQIAYSLFDKTFGNLEDLKEKYGTIGGAAIKAITNQLKYKLGPQLESWISDTLSAFWTKKGDELSRALGNRKGISLKFEEKDLWAFAADIVGMAIGDENTAMYLGLVGNVLFADGVKSLFAKGINPENLYGLSINAKPFSYDQKMGAAVGVINGATSAGGWQDVANDAGNGALSGGIGYDDSQDMFLIRGNEHITAVFGPTAYGASKINGIRSTVWNMHTDAYMMYRISGLIPIPVVASDHKVAIETMKVIRETGKIPEIAPIGYLPLMYDLTPTYITTLCTFNNFLPMGYSYIRNGKPKNADSGYVMCEMENNQHADSYVQRALSKTSMYSGAEYDQDAKSTALVNEALKYKQFADEVDDEGGYKDLLTDLTENPKVNYDRVGDGEEGLYIFGPFKMHYIRKFAYDSSRGAITGTDKVEFGTITDMDIYNQDGKIIDKNNWTIIFDDETKLQREEHDEDYEFPYDGEEFYIAMRNYNGNDTQSISKIKTKFNEMQVDIKYSKLLSQYTMFIILDIPYPSPEGILMFVKHEVIWAPIPFFSQSAVNVVTATKLYKEYDLDIELHRKETGTGAYETEEYYTTSSVTETGTYIISTANGRDMNSEALEGLRELYYNYGITGMITNGTTNTGPYAGTTDENGNYTGKTFNEALKETLNIHTEAQQKNGNEKTQMMSQMEAVSTILGDSKWGNAFGIATTVFDPNASVLSKVLAVGSYFDKSGKVKKVSNIITYFDKAKKILTSQSNNAKNQDKEQDNDTEEKNGQDNKSETKEKSYPLFEALVWLKDNFSFEKDAKTMGVDAAITILKNNGLGENESKIVSSLATNVLNNGLDKNTALSSLKNNAEKLALSELLDLANNKVGKDAIDIINATVQLANSNGDINTAAMNIITKKFLGENSELSGCIEGIINEGIRLFGGNSEKYSQYIKMASIAAAKYASQEASKTTTSKEKSTQTGNKANKIREEQNKNSDVDVWENIPFSNPLSKLALNAAENDDEEYKTYTQCLLEAYYEMSDEPNGILGKYTSAVEKLDLTEMPALTAQISNSANIEALVECLDGYIQRKSANAKPDRFADTEEANAILFDRTAYEEYSPKFTINSTGVPTQVYYSNYDQVGLTIGFAGNVWKDGHTGLENNYNGIRDANAVGQLERGIEGVKVSLIDRKTGKLAFRYRSSKNNKQMLPAITYTDEGGYYVIERVPVGEYDVQFEYDGQTYKVMDDSALSGGNIQDYIEDPNHEKYLLNSKAIEDPVERQEFNDRFYEIVPGNGWETAFAISKDVWNAESQTYAYIESGDGVKGYNKKNIMRDDKTGLTDIPFTGERTPTGRVKTKLIYNKDEGISTLITKDNRNRVLPEFAMHAKTSLAELTYPLHDQFALENEDYFITIDGNKWRFHDAGEYMYHINLGLIERSKIDVGITSDVYKVVTTVNQKEETYVYNARGNYGIFDSVLKQTQTYRNYKYTRELYNADYKFRVSNYKFNSLNVVDKYNNLTKNDAEGKNLFVDIQDAKLMTPTGQYVEEKEIEQRIFITYKLAIKNQSILQSATINEILDSFNHYGENKGSVVNQDIKAWIQDEDGNLVYKTIAQQSYFERKYETRPLEQRQVKWENYSLYDKNQWNGVYTTGLKNEMLATNDVIYLYVTFELERDGNDSIVLEDIENYVEITNYSSFPNWAHNKYYSEGLIDKDSLPGNMTVYFSENDNENDNEDDTDASPVLTLKLYEKGSNKNGRIINGYVWDDERDVTLETGQRIGNGLWDDGEDIVNGVRVQLVEKIRNPYYGNEYEYVWKEMKTNDQVFNAVKNGNGDADRRHS